MKVYLVRHGLAKSKADDPSRGLTAEGKVHSQNVASQLLERIGDKVSKVKIFHSRKLRAIETARSISNILNPQIIPCSSDDLNPMDDPQRIIELIDNQNDDLMFVGHLPFMAKLLEALLRETGSDIEFHPSTVVCVEKVASNSEWEISWKIDP